MLVRVLQAIVLGLVQGATEFVPISSSAHLIVVPWLLGWSDPALTSLSFDVALHVGTLLAVLIFFAADWVRLARAWLTSVRERRLNGDPSRKLAWLVLIGTIPGALAGMALEGRIDRLFHTPGTPVDSRAILAMAALIVVLGLLLLLADRLASHANRMHDLSLKHTLLIGMAQALAVLPGVSRSGSTLTAGLAAGMERESAARFSFLLAAPIIAGAAAKSLVEVLGQLRSGALGRADMVLFAAGLITAAVSGYLVIGLLLRYLQRRSAVAFVYYRWGLAALLILVVLVRG